MAINCLMTWEHPKYRWRKMHRGIVYTISCSQLGTEPTKESSYRQANAWWRNKLTDILISSRKPTPTHPNQRLIDENRRRRVWAQSQGHTDLAENLEANSAILASTSLEDITIAAITHDPSQTSQAIWQERLGTTTTPTVPNIVTIGSFAEQYLALGVSRFHAGLVSASEVALTRLCLRHFINWIGAANHPNVITSERWEGYWIHLTEGLANGTAGRTYTEKRRHYAKHFITWLTEKGVIPLPMNLSARRYAFKSSPKNIKTFDPIEVSKLINNADGQMKLHLLLMSNCGFTQVDIADLRQSEVDWTLGRITRRRSKAKNHAHAPLVAYPLWPETFRLLTTHRSPVGDRVLLDADGRQWVDSGITEGKTWHRDTIRANFRTVDSTHPLKVIRATSASLLDGHAQFGRFAQHFLGHVGATMASKHYLNRGVESEFAREFDLAIQWLGQQYGF